MLLKAGWGSWDCQITCGVIETVDLGHEDDPIACFWVHAETPKLMYDIHFQVSMGVAMIGVVDGFVKYLVVERVVESERENLIEGGENLGFNVSRIDASSDVVQHVLDVGEVDVVEGLHPFESHLLSDVDGLHGAGGGQAPAEEPLAEGEFLIIGDGVGQDGSYILSSIP